MSDLYRCPRVFSALIFYTRDCSRRVDAVLV